MAILFHFPTQPFEAWVDGLRAAFPDWPVRTVGALGDPAAIRYALVWQPPAGLLATLPNLKGVLNLGAGIDGVLADPTLPAEVPLVRLINRGLTEGMVEYVAWQVLDWHRNGPLYRRRQADRHWTPAPDRLAADRTVAVMGLGVLGAAAARALVALGFRVIGWSRTEKAVDGVTGFVGPAGLDPFLAEAACLVCLLPLTEETQGCLDRDLFRRLPAGGHLINAARGGHLVESDLLAALADGRPASAALDVLVDEPPGDGHPFWDHPAITLTPHVAAATSPAESLAGVIAAIRDLEAGRAPAGLVDRGRGY